MIRLVVDNVADIKDRLKQLRQMEKKLMPRINIYVSDIYFNIDMTDCCTEEEGYDRGKLINEAVWFLEALSRLEVKELPTADQLVDDFLARL